MPGLLLFGLRVLAAEAFDAAGRVDNLLLAGEERMAVRTDFNVYVTAMGATSQKTVAARALHAYFVITGMDCCFHDLSETSAPKNLL